MDINKYNLVQQNPNIVAAISKASQATKVDFDYLLDTAIIESGLKVNSKAPTSSATGLFQFLSQTWLEVMKEFGDKYGLSHLTKHISIDEKNSYVVKTGKAKKEIFDLRKDSYISAVMAGELTRKNYNNLAKEIGRTPLSGELYSAHFLGKTGATRLIKLAAFQPNQPANQHFEKAAASNRHIFYTDGGEGRPRSVKEVYFELVNKYSRDNRSNANFQAQLNYKAKNVNNGGFTLGLADENTAFRKNNIGHDLFSSTGGAYNNKNSGDILNNSRMKNNNIYASNVNYDKYSFDNKSNKYEWRGKGSSYSMMGYNQDSAKINVRENNLGSINMNNMMANNYKMDSNNNNRIYEDRLRNSLESSNSSASGNRGINNNQQGNVNKMLLQFLYDKSQEAKQTLNHQQNRKYENIGNITSLRYE